MADKRERRLADAVWAGDRAKAEELLAEGVSANSRNAVSSALRAAVCTRRPDLVELLLRHGADVEDRGDPRDRGSLLLRAVGEEPRSETLATVRLLVQHGAALDARDDEGATPLLVAVREAARRSPAVLGKMTADLTELLAALGGGLLDVPVEAPPEEQKAPETDRFAMVDTLLSLGARLDDRDAAGNTAAVIACLEQDEELLAGLRERGADDAEVAVAQLLEAASEGREAEVAALLARGVDSNRRFTRRGTPLSEAARDGHLAVVELLLQAGADPNLSESEGPEGDFNPLFRAVYSGHLEIVRRLLAAGADPLRKGPGGARVLDSAKSGAKGGHKKDAPWNEILTMLREALRQGPARIGLAPPDAEPPVAVELRAVLPELAGLAWSRTRAGGIEILECAPFPGKLTPDWDRLREIARRHGYAPFFAPWSLQDLEPEVEETERNLAAIDADTGRASIAGEIERWLQAVRAEAEEMADRGEEEEDDDEEDESLPKRLETLENGPIPRKPRELRLRLDGHHLVLLGGDPEAAIVLYGLGQPGLEPVLLASILKSWRETTGAELAASKGATLDLVLLKPIEDEAMIRRCALEIHVVDPDLEGARHLLGMTASRHWSFWWD